MVRGRDSGGKEGFVAITPPKRHIARHELTQGYASDADFREALALCSNQSDSEAYVHKLVSTTANAWATCRLAADPQADQELTRRVVRLSGQAAAVAFRAALLNPGQRILVKLDNRQFQVAAPDERNVLSMLAEHAWVRAAWLAFVARNTVSMQILADFPSDRLAPNHPPGKSVPALQALFAGHENEAVELLAGLGRSEGWVPELLRLALTEDSAGFSDVLEAALLAHQKFYSRKANTSDIHGVVSWPLTAAACFAGDRGVAVGVTSGYLPERLILNRGWAKELTDDAGVEPLFSPPGRS